VVEFDVSGGIVMAGTRILLPIAIATVLPGVSIPLSGSLTSNLGAIGTIGTIGSPVQVVGTVTTVGGGSSSISTVQSPVGVVGTIATIQSQSPVVVSQGYLQTSLVTATTLFANGSGTLTTGSLQDMVVDAVFGTVVTGSIQLAVMGVEPQQKIQTSTILAGSWFAGTAQAGQRLQVGGPLGGFVAVKWSVPGSVLAVSVTAQQSATG
jgi:hypothetical protein